jgi:PAS domain S-box-containing protein
MLSKLSKQPIMRDILQPEAQMPIDEKHLVQALFTHASIGILVANQKGEIILANPFILDQFGYSGSELIGKKVELLIPNRFHDRHVHHREKFTAHMQNRPMGAGMDLFGVHKDGTEFPVEVSLCHYSNDEGSFVVAFINNITIRKKAEEEIRRLNDELEDKVDERTHQLKDALTKLEASKEVLARSLGKEKDLNELKSRFVSIASHEFRTPLSTILSSTYLLQKYTTAEDQPKREKHIERIVSSVNTLTDILNDFLSVGKIEEGKIMLKPSTINIKELISRIVGELRNIGKSGQSIIYTHKGKQLVVMDPTLLKHIVLNLVSNAIKFSLENSVIEVSTDVKNGQLLFKTKDHGVGIPKEDQVHLFERFFRGSNVGNIQGTGLGLHIVSKYAELMNGKISCNSSPGTGTVMSVLFDLTGTSENKQAGTNEIEEIV